MNAGSLGRACGCGVGAPLGWVEEKPKGTPGVLDPPTLMCVYIGEEVNVGQKWTDQVASIARTWGGGGEFLTPQHHVWQ